MPMIFSAAIPMVACYLIGLVLFALVPRLVTWLPGLV